MTSAAWAAGSSTTVATLPRGQAAKSHIVVPVRIPIGEERLRQLKAQASRAPAVADPSEVVVPEAKAPAKAPAPANVVTNCIDVGAGNGTVAHSDISGAVGFTNMVTVSSLGVGVYNGEQTKSRSLLRDVFS